MRVHSLLWPGGPTASEPLATVREDALRDLELDAVVDWIAHDRPDRRGQVRQWLARPPVGPETIAWRSAVMRDLLASARLGDALEAAGRELRHLAQNRPQHFPQEVGRAARIGARVEELQSYLEVLQTLDQALGSPDAQAPALAALREDVQAILRDPTIGDLRRELPGLAATLDSVRSVTVAVNVSPAMEPESAVIVGFSNRPVSLDDSALLRFSRDSGQRRPVRLFRRTPVDWQDTTDQMVKGVRALLEAVAGPVERALHSYRTIQTQAISHLEDEITVLVGAARMARDWRTAGLPCAIAEVVADTQAEWMAEDAFHPVLARQLARPLGLTLNRIRFAGPGTVWILTGPNRGGKTTYLRAAGVVQVLGQCGLPVPARAARIRPAQRVFTHFPAPEVGVAGQGRLDEEAERMGQIFRECLPGDMVLLNEVLAGTSAPEGVALAADILRGLRVAGCNAIYATHLHELAGRAEDLGASVDGPSAVGTLTVQTVVDHGDGTPIRRPTYRVVPGQPEGASFFASEIARRHGVSLPQIVDLLRERGVVRP